MSRREEEAVHGALELVATVRDLDRDSIAKTLTGHDRTSLEAIAVALAAMVPVDASPSDLLAWCHPDTQRREAARRREIFRAAQLHRRVKPHGTHAAYVRHKNNGTQPCDLCIAAERTYQRERKRRQRELAQEAAA